MRGLFITGTDTGVGKTYVATAIVRACRAAGVRVGAYKPVCTGAEEVHPAQSWADVSELMAALAGDVPIDHVCPQRFGAPLAPPAAARSEGRIVDAALLHEGAAWWQDHAELLVVEGVGGLLCPLTETLTIADFAAELGFRLIIVVGLKLGAVNHTLLTIDVASQRGLSVAGLILNHVSQDDGAAQSSIAEITARSALPILGILPNGSAGELRAPEMIRKIDWFALSSNDQPA